jgi:hypothetical protein
MRLKLTIIYRLVHFIEIYFEMYKIIVKTKKKLHPFASPSRTV